jgi:hypothetical protein
MVLGWSAGCRGAGVRAVKVLAGRWRAVAPVVAFGERAWLLVRWPASRFRRGGPVPGRPGSAAVGEEFAADPLVDSSNSASWPRAAAASLASPVKRAMSAALRLGIRPGVGFLYSQD